MGKGRLLCLKWITNKDLCFYIAQGTLPSYLADWIGGEFRGEWIHVYVWLSPFAAHLEPPQHC